MMIEGALLPTLFPGEFAAAASTLPWSQLRPMHFPGESAVAAAALNYVLRVLDCLGVCGLRQSDDKDSRLR